MNSKARITYRFEKGNGARVERKPEEIERPIKSNVVPFFQEELKFSSDVGTWNSPFQDDSYALEQLIRETDNQVNTQLPSKPSRASSEERKHRPLTEQQLKAKQKPLHSEAALHHSQQYHREWVDHVPLGDELAGNSPTYGPDVYPIIELDEYEEQGKGKPYSGATSFGSFKTAKNYRPSHGPSWYKVFASVTGAIVTGALFGYFVLALFTGGEAADESANTNLPAVGSSVSDTATSGSGKRSSDNGAVKSGTDDQANSGVKTNNQTGTGNTDSTAAIQVNIPQTSYYMLQYGVFSNKESLDAAIAELNGKGLAAAPYSAEDDYRIFVGMATDRNNALALSQSLSDMNVYIKQIDLPALSAIAFKGDAATVESFFKQTDELIRLMDGMTVGKLGQTTAKDDESWSELHQQWTKSASVMENGIVDKEGKAALLKLVQQVNTAAVAAQEYAKNQSDSHLWSIQTALMNAVFAQKAWFASMDAL